MTEFGLSLYTILRCPYSEFQKVTLHSEPDCFLITQVLDFSVVLVPLKVTSEERRINEIKRETSGRKRRNHMCPVVL